MRKKGYVMDEVMSPCAERRCLISENLAIPQDPNVPSCCKDHFSEERMPKILPSLYCHVVSCHPRLWVPDNLQVILDSNAKITREEQMCTIFMDQIWT